MENLGQKILVEVYDCLESAVDKDGEHFSIEPVTNIRYSKDNIEEAEYVLIMDKRTKKVFKLLAPIEVHRKHLTDAELKDVEDAEECIDDNAERANY